MNMDMNTSGSADKNFEYKHIEYTLLSEKAGNGGFVKITDSSYATDQTVSAEGNSFSHYYGGDQGWFLEILGDGGKNETGCGSVAAANVLMYYAQINYGSVGHRFYEEADLVTKERFTGFMNTLYTDYVKQTVTLGFGQTKKSLGIWTIGALSKGLVRYAEEKGISLNSHIMGNNFRNKDFAAAVTHIREALKLNCPVVLLARTNEYAKSLGIEMSDLHFVTITGMREKWSLGKDSQDEKKRSLVDASLTVSTWGRKTVIPSIKDLWNSADGSIKLTDNMPIDFKIIKSAFGNVFLSYYTIL